MVQEHVPWPKRTRLDNHTSHCTHKEGSTGTSRWLQCDRGDEGCTCCVVMLTGTEVDINTK